MNIIKTTIAIALCSAMTGCTTSFDGTIIPASSSTLEHEMMEGVYKAPNDVQMAFRAYVPNDAMPNSIPLIVYLHGAGQNGDDNKRQLDEGVGCLYSFTTGRDDYKSMIAVPQCPAGVYWRDDDVLEALRDFILAMAENPIVDKDRIYITGFSMGGDASWKLALNYPDLMTTIVPVCGGPLASMEPDIPDVPPEMSLLNIWAFNNFDDGVVRPAYSKRIFGELWSESDSDKLNFTLNVSGGHSAEKVYKNRDILIWMLSTRKND